MWNEIFICFLATFLSTSLLFSGCDLFKRDKRFFKTSSQEIKQAYTKFTPLCLINVFVFLPICLYMTIPTFKQNQLNTQTVLCDLIFFSIVFEIFFYASHRFLHTCHVFKTIHYVHHQMKDTSIAFGAFHCHPLEFVFGNFLPAVLSVFLNPDLNLAHVKIWACIAAFYVATSHSGYQIFYQKPLHLLHHKLTYARNFGTLAFMDIFFDTN